MRFLVEAEQRFNDLVQAKSYLESQTGKKYLDLNSQDRVKFIDEVLKLMNNKKILTKNRMSVIKALQDSRFGVENQNVITYLNGLQDNGPATDNIIQLITTLILKGNLDYPTAKNWLNNKSLYDRSITDIDYTIKALTLAANKNLQKDYFKEPLKVEDLIDESGNIFTVAKIKDILDMNQAKEVETKASGEKLISDALNKSDITIDDVKEYLKSIYGDKLTKEISDVIDTDSIEDSLEDIINRIYISDKNSSSKDKLDDALKKAISSVDNTNKEKGTTGQDILKNILRSSGKEVNKESALEYIKNLFKEDNRRSIMANAIDQGIVDTQINKILNKRYKDTLISDAKELLDYDLKKELIDAVNN